MLQQTDPRDIAKLLIGTPVQSWQKTGADGAAATATAETTVGRVGSAFQLGAVHIVPGAALTADPTNNATITVFKRTAGGAATAVAVGVTAASGANATGSWTAWVSVPMTLVSGAFVSAGDVLTVSITKGGSGVVVPQGTIEIYPA